MMSPRCVRGARIWDPMITCCLTCSNSDRKSTRLNSSHSQISYAVFCLKKKKFHLARMTVMQHADHAHSLFSRAEEVLHPVAGLLEADETAVRLGSDCQVIILYWTSSVP